MPRKVPFALLAASWLLAPAIVGAQTQPPAESLTFDAAISRAIEKNPTVAIAAQGILRAEALLQQASTVFRPTLGGTVVVTTLDSARGFDDQICVTHAHGPL